MIQHLVDKPIFTGQFYIANKSVVKGLHVRNKTTFFNAPEKLTSHGSWSRGIVTKYGTLLINIDITGKVSWISEKSIHDIEVIRGIIENLFQIINLDTLINKPIFHNPPRNLPLLHVRSASLFEAIVKAIIRQVVRASQAKLLIDRFVKEIAGIRLWEGDEYYIFPDENMMADISEKRLQNLGLGYKAKMIKNIAHEIGSIESNLTSANPDPTTLLEILQQVKGIGNWSSRVVAADYWGMWDLYPFDDLAVRTMAKHYMYEYPWEQTPEKFKKQWENMWGSEIGIMTYYVLSGIWQKMENTADDSN